MILTISTKKPNKVMRKWIMYRFTCIKKSVLKVIFGGWLYGVRGAGLYVFFFWIYKPCVGSHQKDCLRCESYTLKCQRLYKITISIWWLWFFKFLLSHLPFINLTYTNTHAHHTTHITGVYLLKRRHALALKTKTFVILCCELYIKWFN